MNDAKPMMIAVRAYAEPVKGTDELPTKGGSSTLFLQKPLPRPSSYSLIFDTETTIDASQSLRIGMYQVRKHERLVEHGIFFDPVALDASEVVDLKAFAEANGLAVLTREDFVREVFYPYVYHKGGLLIGFNLPFDLSRLAISIRTSQGRDMRNGFTLKLVPEKWHPPVLVRHLNSRTSFIRFAAAAIARDSRSARKRGQWTPPRKGFFLDVRTLAGALLGGSFSLGGLAKLLRTDHAKQETEEHGGRLTREYLTYAVTDVQVTWECCQALAQHFDGHGIKQTPAHRIYSEASLGKAYLKEMGIQPWTKLQPLSRPKSWE